jgi:hypothetical protein
MGRTQGYGVWRAQVPPPVATAQPGAAEFVYFDGFNTATCHAQHYGPLWIVTGLSQTMVGCSQGLSASGDQACPRKAYGVIQ